MSSTTMYGVLILDALGVPIELLSIVLGPPILQIALGVELAALVVKAMRQFVPDRAPVLP